MADEEKNVEQAEAQQPVDQTTAAPQAGEAAAQQTERDAEEARRSPRSWIRRRPDLAKEQDNYLRLAAEYDNFRKRSQKEKDNLYTRRARPRR